MKTQISQKMVLQKLSIIFGYLLVVSLFSFIISYLTASAVLKIFNPADIETTLVITVAAVYTVYGIFDMSFALRGKWSPALFIIAAIDISCELLKSISRGGKNVDYETDAALESLQIKKVINDLRNVRSHWLLHSILFVGTPKKNQKVMEAFKLLEEAE